jgi:hypothetical protein
MATFERAWTNSINVAPSGASLTAQYQDVVYRLLTEMLAMPGAVIGPNSDSVNTSNTVLQIGSAAEIVRGIDGTQPLSYWVVTLGDQHVLVVCNNSNALPAQSIDIYMSSAPYALVGVLPARNRPITSSGNETTVLQINVINSTSLVTRRVNVCRDSVGSLLFSTKRAGVFPSDAGIAIVHTANPDVTAYRRALFVGQGFDATYLQSVTYWRNHLADGTAATNNVRAFSNQWGLTSAPGGFSANGAIERGSIAVFADAGVTAQCRSLRRWPDIQGVGVNAAPNTRDSLDVDAFRPMTFDDITVPSAQAQADFQ